MLPPKTPNPWRELLLESESHRHFLREAFAHLKASRPGFSLAVFARATGCRAKSYPREVITGRRRLSLDYAGPFAAALGLRGDGKRLFLRLVALDRAEGESARSTLAAEVAQIKRRMRNRVEHRRRAPADLFRQTGWIDVFASLGSAEEGASLAEIARRSELPERELRPLLAEMMAQGLVVEHAGAAGVRYGAVGNHHFFTGAGQDSIFERRYLEILGRVGSKARRGMKSDQDLFVCSTISVRSADLGKLKAELRAVLDKFLQDAESPKGDRLAHLSLGLIS